MYNPANLLTTRSKSTRMVQDVGMDRSAMSWYVPISFDPLPFYFSDNHFFSWHQLRLTCGTENAILSVQELEKCEYEFTGTSPALCLPIEEGNNSREEL